MTDHMGGKCEICGYDKCLVALEAHHVDPSTKDFSISDVASLDRIERELEKCVLLCANCHREVHDGLHPGYLVHEGESLWAGFEVPEIPGDDLSYTEELELEEVIQLAEQISEENTEPSLRTEQKRRNIGHGSSLRRSQPRSH